MKRESHLFDKICSIRNLKLAHKRACRGKSNQYGVKRFNKQPQDLLINLHHVLLNGDYRTSNYTVFTIQEKKERVIYRLPYYPDRIVHHAVMNTLEKIFVRSFTTDTYSCIKRRGVHKCAKKLRKALNTDKEQYCLKLDIRKFYPSIDHEIMKSLIRRKIKDPRLLILLDEIVDSAEGLPIGNYLSQYLANFYLARFDHWLKEELKVKNYFRYCDDLVILGSDKSELRQIFYKIRDYLEIELKLQVKDNWQIFPIASRGIDFVGYKFYHTHTLIRDSIKRDFIRMIKHNKNKESIAAYNGWLRHCNSINLQKKYLS